MPDSPAAAARLAHLRAVFPRELGPTSVTRFERHHGLRAAVPSDATASVELPSVASGTARIVDVASGMAASFRLIGAADVAPEVASGIAIYPGAAPGGADVLHRLSAAGVEDYAVFEHAPAIPELRYHVDVRGIAGLRLVENTLELVDGSGTPRLRVAPPWIVDAAGTRRAATLELPDCAADRSPRAPWGRAPTPPGASGCTIVVRFDPSHMKDPILLDPQWISTKTAMITARARHTATLLDSTDPASVVLVAGGIDDAGDAIAAAELYEPLGRTFATTGALVVARGAHTATPLADAPVAGVPVPVLFAGGQGPGGAPLASTEIYDPASGAFTTDLSMSAARRDHTATRFGDGLVLLAGGIGAANQSLKSADRYTLAPKSLAPTGAMGTARGGHADVLLGSGGVLVAGGLVTGFGQQSAEIYTPASGTFAPIAPLGGGLAQMTVPRAFHTATRLADGAVLIAGGVNDAAGTITWSTAEIYLDGTTKRGFVQPVIAMTSKRSGHTASLLASGNVLLAGGSDGTTTLGNSEIYDASASSFSAFLTMTAARRGHAATVVNAGGAMDAGRSVVLTGGFGAAGAPLASAEIVVRKLGEACALDAECTSGHCVAGMCCDEACTGKCQSCAAAVKGSGIDGTCGNTAAGTAAGVECVAGSDAELHSNCDGNGNAVVAFFVDCKPNACAPDGLSCLTFCDDTVACSTSGWCDVGATGDGGVPDDAGTGAGICQKKRDDGALCTSDEQCTHAHCVDGVCCENACTGQCEACDQVGFTGLCRPVGTKTMPEQVHGTRTPCPGDGDCRGLCDGTSPLACVFANAGKSCGGTSCACEGDGCTTAKLTSAICGSDGLCADVTSECPNGLRCDAAGEACTSTCKTDDDCVAEHFCNETTHACEALTGPRCDGAHTIRLPMEADQDCTPYRCQGTACLTECKSVDDCVSPKVCDVSGKCVDQLEAPVITSCAIASTDRGAGSTDARAMLGALALAALTLLGRRSRRA
ncbi:Kelch-like protein 1 [Minicystis rosea]|nr:Kelch-like protein 1 [Minicystis rosea]